MNKVLSTHGYLVWALTIMLIFVSAGCTVKLISDYDEQTDRSVTQLQKDFEWFFESLSEAPDPPACDYSNFKQFYIESKIKVGAIKLRAEAIPRNELTVKQIIELESALGSLEKLHQIGCIDEMQAEPLRRNFNTIFGAIFKLELAKKRGVQPE